MGKLTVIPRKPDPIAEEEFKLRRARRDVITKCTVMWTVHDAETNEIIKYHVDSAVLGRSVFVADATEEGQTVRVPLSSMPTPFADAFRRAGKVKKDPPKELPSVDGLLGGAPRKDDDG